MKVIENNNNSLAFLLKTNYNTSVCVCVWKSNQMITMGKLIGQIYETHSLKRFCSKNGECAALNLFIKKFISDSKNIFI